MTDKEIVISYFTNKAFGEDGKDLKCAYLTVGL